MEFENFKLESLGWTHEDSVLRETNLHTNICDFLREYKNIEIDSKTVLLDDMKDTILKEVGVMFWNYKNEYSLIDVSFEIDDVEEGFILHNNQVVAINHGGTLFSKSDFVIENLDALAHLRNTKDCCENESHTQCTKVFNKFMEYIQCVSK